MHVETQYLSDTVLRCISPEKVVFFVVKDSHTPPTSLGCPTNGGIRIQAYPDEAAAIDEAHGLAKRMTHKQALYNTGFGGVKIVVSASPDGLDKRALMDAIAQVLWQLGGTVYTGCDLNTNDSDMRYLAEQCPYVLAGIGSNIDPSQATASGVYGAILGSIGIENIPHKRFLVHGLGKIGAAVAQRLQADGATILSYDICPARADYPGFHNVSAHSDWWTLDFDVLVPCSASNIVTPAIAQQLTCQTIVGSANLPFSDTETVAAILDARKIFWVPDIVSSAGAVIADSIEHYAPDVFRYAHPEDVYRFISQLICHKTQYLMAGVHAGASVTSMQSRLIYQKPGQPVCGLLFQPSHQGALPMSLPQPQPMRKVVDRGINQRRTYLHPTVHITEEFANVY